MSLLLAFQGYQQVVTTLEFRSQLESLSVNDLKNIYFWLCWVFVAALAFLQLRCMGILLWWLLLLQNTGSRASGLQQLQHIGSVVVALRLQSIGSISVAYQISCSVACGIFLLQASNPYFLCWQEDSLPLSNQGSPSCFYVYCKYKCIQFMLLP